MWRDLKYPTKKCENNSARIAKSEKASQRYTLQFQKIVEISKIYYGCVRKPPRSIFSTKRISPSPRCGWIHKLFFSHFSDRCKCTDCANCHRDPHVAFTVGAQTAPRSAFSVHCRCRDCDEVRRMCEKGVYGFSHSEEMGKYVSWKKKLAHLLTPLFVRTHTRI